MDSKLKEFVSNLPKVGAGAFSQVFDTFDGFVMKIPYTFLEDGTRDFLHPKKRKKFVKRTIEATMMLNKKMGNIVVPVFLGKFNTIRQVKIEGEIVSRLDCKRRSALLHEANNAINIAFEIFDRNRDFKDLYVDSSNQNFIVDKEENIFWIDPVASY